MENVSSAFSDAGVGRQPHFGHLFVPHRSHHEINLETKVLKLPAVALSRTHCCVTSGPLNSLVPGSAPLSLEAFLTLLQTLEDTVPGLNPSTTCIYLEA